MISERTRPHVVTADALVLRWGHLPIATVPWFGHQATFGVHRRFSADDDRLTHDVPLQGTNSTWSCTPPSTRGPVHQRRRRVGISLGVDDPEAAADLIRSRLAPYRR